MPERHSTRTSYQSYINNYIRPRWDELLISAIKPVAVEGWLKELKDLAPATKRHLREIMRTIFTCGQRWELIEHNPIALVRVRGGSKRGQRPLVLTVDQYREVLAQLAEPYRTMALVAGCLGLRISEIMALRWSDFNFLRSTLLVQRSIVHGRVDDVKTEYSRDHVPVDPRLADALLRYRDSAWYPTVEQWVFANPRTGRPYHQETIQRKHIRPAGMAIGLAAPLGWHSFRHSYRSWLDEEGTPISVQKELMRHASIQTTMNVYGRAMSETKRKANSNVVGLLITNPIQDVENKADSTRQTNQVGVNGSDFLATDQPSLLKGLVAGEGFEPSTFGL